MTSKHDHREQHEPNPYEQWLSDRRESRPSTDLTDQIMSRVAEIHHRRYGDWSVMLAQQIDRRPLARLAVCVAALAIGCLPFFFLTHVSSF